MSDTEYETKASSLAEEIGEFLKEHWDKLTGKERFILSLGKAKLGMKPGQCRTYREIAGDARVSRQAIENIERRALRKCRSTSLRILSEGTSAMETANDITALPEARPLRFGQRVFHHLFGAGHVAEEWGNFRACKVCYREAPLGTASRAVQINGCVRSEHKTVRCTDEGCGGPTQVVNGEGTYDVIFDDGKTRSINGLWLVTI